MTTFLICLGIGLTAGALSGLAGIGGGVVIVPLLIYFLGMTQHQAQGASLAVIMTGVLSLVVYYKNGHINVPVVLMVGLGFIIGGYFGSSFAVNLPAAVLKKVFAAILLLISLRMLLLK